MVAEPVKVFLAYKGVRKFITVFTKVLQWIVFCRILIQSTPSFFKMRINKLGTADVFTGMKRPFAPRVAYLETSIYIYFSFVLFIYILLWLIKTASVV
jgi:hypothetical protein